jgi:predicted porin
MSIRRADPKGSQSCCGRPSGKLAPAALAALVLFAAGARADEPAKPIFSFSGFGTLGLVHSSEKNADFVSSGLKPNGAGFTRSWSADVDSLLAGQVTANFTPQLSGVLQVLAEQNYDNTYRPHVEWANVKYQLTPDFSLRVGRAVLPTFLLSDTRKVSYTYPWVRPPSEVYQLVPISSSDGVEASYRAHFGELTNTMQVNLGRGGARLVDGGKVTARNAWAITNTAEHGPLVLRVTYQRAILNISSVDALFGGFRQFGPQGVAIANQYDPNGKSISFIGVGASYDPGKWFVMSEWARNENRSFIGKRSGWYASGGYRFGEFTPYVIYARVTAEKTSDPGLATAGLPPALAGAAAALNGGLNAALGRNPLQDTVSVGGRWDFSKSAALKLQFDHTRFGAGSAGVLRNVQPGFQTGGKVNVFSASVDFVF